MRKALYLAVAAFAALSTDAFAMGGGGGGGYGFGNAPSAAFDDYSTGRRLILHERYAEAIPHLEKALAKHPRDADILNYLGYAHRMVGASETDPARQSELKISLAYYQEALQIDPGHKRVHEYLGELYLQMNDLPSAQREMTLLASLCPDGCDERDALTKAIAAYAPAPAATQAPASPESTPGAAQTPPAQSNP